VPVPDSAASALSPSDDRPAGSHGLLYSLIDYHWHEAAWQRDETARLREFFSRAVDADATLKSSLVEELVDLPSMALGSEAPEFIGQFLIVSGLSLLSARKLADEFIGLCGESFPRAPATAIADCTHAALRRATASAFDVYAGDIRECAITVSLLQKLFFFQAALLRDLFSNTESFSAGGFDESTGLPDHRTIVSNLADILGNRHEERKPLAILLVHVTFSHLASDASAYAQNELLLTMAAERLQRALRETDMVGRLNRDEFMVILPHVSGSGLAILAANKIIRELSEPFDAEAGAAYARTLVGITLFPDHALEAETLLHYAEIAREVARQGREHYALYDPEFHRKDRVKRSLEAMLRVAMQDNNLQIHFQPKADLQSGAIVGAESLLRWTPADMGPIPPMQIIGVAEESGLISSLTMWVINTSLRHQAAMVKMGIDLRVSVNVTASNLSDPELLHFIAQALGTWNVSPEKLVIELTETAMIGDHERTIATLHRMKDMGLALSVDDFGTGYSSLAYLKRMPLDELKVDQSFVRNMLTVKEDERIVRSIIDLAHNFDLRVVAEGVEDITTLEFLRALGCDIAQGYLISKPLPVDHFVTWWKACNGSLLHPG
jgi:diguanylate cyclase